MQAKTKNNNNNAVERGRTQCVKVDVQGTRSNNTGECWPESNSSDTKSYGVEGTKCNVFLCLNGSGR